MQLHPPSPGRSSGEEQTLAGRRGRTAIARPCPCPHLGAAAAAAPSRAGQKRRGRPTNRAAAEPAPEHPAGPARAEQGGPATRLPAGAAGEPLGQGRTRGRGSGTVLRPERGRRRPSPAHRQERPHFPTATGNGRFPFRFPLPSRPLPHLPPRTVGQAGGTDPAAPLPLPGRAPGPPRSPQRRPAAAHGSARPRSLTIG